jgi:protein-S-isoprenylcysteine O-methyltransferase Ste14
MQKKDHPGVYIPPPLIYVAFFFLSVALQKAMPLNSLFLQTAVAATAGRVLLIAGILVLLPALWKFLVSKNTLITINPAHYLQTAGIYSFTRNPIYLGLLLLYSGIGFFKGNWWTFIVIPLLIITVQVYIISKEEHYLQRAFGNAYLQYKKKVRRWI